MAIGFTATLDSSGANFTTTTSADEQKIFYSRILLERAKEVTVFNELGQKATIPRNGGKQIEWRRFDPLPLPTTSSNQGGGSTTGAATNSGGYPVAAGTYPRLTELTPGNGRGLTFNKVTATVAQYGDFITGSDLVDVTSIDPIITIATELLAQQASEVIDVITREIICAGTNVLFATRVTDGVTPINLDQLYSGATGYHAPVSFNTLVAARKIMFANKAMRPGGTWPMIIGADVWADLMRDADLKATWNYGSKDNLIKGEIGSYLGISFRETTLGRTAAGTLTSYTAAYQVNYSHVVGANSYGTVSVEGLGLETITKEPGSGGATGDPLNMLWSQGWKCTHQAVILNQNWLLRVMSSTKL